MSVDQFTKLFNFMSEHFDNIDKKLASKTESVDMHRAFGLLDALTKRQEIPDVERLVMNHQS